MSGSFDVSDPGGPPPRDGAEMAQAIDDSASARVRQHPGRTKRAAWRSVGFVGLAVHRMRYHRGLTLLALVGVIMAIGLISSAGFFAQAVDTVILRRGMAEYSRATGSPPFTARVFTPSTRTIPLTLSRSEDLGEHVAGTLSAEVGLPVRSLRLQANSGVIRLRQGEESSRNINVFYVKDIGPGMTLVDGVAMDAAPSPDQLDMWIHRAEADKTGLQVGEVVSLSTAATAVTVPARIAGIWEATDPDDAFWMGDPVQSLGDKYIVRRDDYARFVESLVDPGVRSVAWQIVLDENAVIPRDVRDYVDGFARSSVVIHSYLPDAQITTPTISLNEFVDRQSSLTTLLLGFNIPGLGFLLYFLVLTSAIIAYWQRQEMTVMLSRGMNRVDVFNFTLVDALILFVVGCPLGIMAGLLMARLMGYATSFLSFTPRPPLPVSLAGLSVPLLLVALAVLLLAKLGSMYASSGRRLLSTQREHFRAVRPPFWYRAYLDLLLILPAWYAYQQLTARGSLAMLVNETPEDLYRDPLLILAPAIFIIVLALLSMRLFAVAMRLADHLARRLPSVSGYMALRQLSRRSHTYINPLLLVTVSLALGVYTLSMAASLNGWLYDRIYYQAGADLAVQPVLESNLYATADARIPGGEWIPPVDEFEALPGVLAATRIGDFPGELHLPTSRVPIRFLGIDRVDFDKVAWYRYDFAGESLGAMLNRLALTPNGILVSERFVESTGYMVGERIPGSIFAEPGTRVDTDLLIAGVYKHFPTVYEDEITLIGNLDLITFESGLTMPHKIWLRLQPNADPAAIIDQIEGDMDLMAISEHDAREEIQEELAHMERVGVFGTLSVSFLAASLMAALGLLTYSYASLEERRLQLAVLRAMGTTSGQVVRQVSIEYLVLILFGGIAGVVIGSLAAQTFVPLFRVANGLQAPLPPMLPILATDKVLPLTAIFLAIMLAMQLLLIAITLRSRLYSALRM